MTKRIIVQSNYRSSLIERNYTRSKVSIGAFKHHSMRELHSFVLELTTYWSRMCLCIRKFSEQNTRCVLHRTRMLYTVQKQQQQHEYIDIGSHSSACNNKNSSILGVARSNDLCAECMHCNVNFIFLSLSVCAQICLCCIHMDFSFLLCAKAQSLFHSFVCPFYLVTCWLTGSHLHSSYIAKTFSCRALSNDSQPKMYLVSTAQDAHSQSLHKIMNNMDAHCTHIYTQSSLTNTMENCMHCTNREQLV